MNHDIDRNESAQWYEWVQQRERDIPPRSCLGSGCCPECGWARDDCHCKQYAAEDAAIAEKGDEAMGDLTTEQDVVALMKLSTTAREWDANCDKVKDANGGTYPPFWYSAIILSNLAERTANTWGSDAKLHLTRMR